MAHPVLHAFWASCTGVKLVWWEAAKLLQHFLSTATPFSAFFSQYKMVLSQKLLTLALDAASLGWQSKLAWNWRRMSSIKACFVVSSPVDIASFLSQDTSRLDVCGWPLAKWVDRMEWLYGWRCLSSVMPIRPKRQVRTTVMRWGALAVQDETFIAIGWMDKRV